MASSSGVSSGYSFRGSGGGPVPPTGSLQDAYEGGNSITTSAPEGNVSFEGTEDFLVSLADVDFDVSGTLNFDATGAIGIGTDADTGAINIGTGAAARQLTIGNTTGATSVDINTGTGNLTFTSPDVIVSTIITVPNTGLHILDTNASHDLIVAVGSDLLADRTLTLTTGDSNRTVDLTGTQGSVPYMDGSGNLVPLAPGTSGYVLTSQGVAANPVWAAGGTTKGTATVDFGASALGTSYIEVVVIGQAGILTTSEVTVTMMAEATADHNILEASIVPVKLSAGDLVNGVGFTIRAFSDWLLNGTFTVRWAWSN